MEQQLQEQIQQPLAIILMGLPAAGKSTFYQRELEPVGIEHINLDTLHTRNKEHLRIQECIKMGVSFAVDNTNILPQERARYIKPAAAAGYRIVGYFYAAEFKNAYKITKQERKKCP